MQPMLLKADALSSCSRIDILSLTRARLEALARQRIPAAAGAAAEVYASVFKTGQFDPEALGLGGAKAAAWEAAFSVTALSPARVLEEPGEFGSTAKAILRLEDGLAVECVRVPMATKGPDEGRSTLCISSQVGCRMGCSFCETGRLGLVRGLSPGEIVAQVLAARFVLGWRFRNIVFMGMGEPLDNAESVFTAIEVLFDRSGLGFAQDRLSLCTSGHVEGLSLLAGRQWPRLNLSVSLNAASDEQRSRLMPVNRRWPLSDLAAALRAYPRGRKSPLALNYCLIPGLNDSPRDAALVAEFCHAIERAPGDVAINLIPYNPGSVPIGREPSEGEIEAFLALLLAEGVKVRRRATHGRSIMAACGQLGAPAGS
jgi:Predicted Fe-S-cluster redox enzyme